METVWGNLLGNRGNYIQNIVNYSSLGGGGDQEDHEDIDSDGHVLNIDNLTSILFDFVGEVCMEKAVKKMFGVMYNTTRGGGGGGGIGASLATGRKNRSSGGGGGSGDATHSNPPSPHLVGLCETFLSYMQISEKQVKKKKKKNEALVF